MAATPSSDPGKKPGTRDEVIYALKRERSNDPRFKAPQGIWSNIVFSEEVKAAVDTRYLRLAGANDDHYVEPAGTPGPGRARGAGGSYRSLHEAAILLAYEAGHSGGKIDEAMAHEAAAAHFLQDAFAAGHLRTPRGSIDAFWRGKYPLFGRNLKSKMAHDVATWVNEHDDILATVAGSVKDIYDAIRSELFKKMASFPESSLGDLVTKVAHDEDNSRGVHVENDAGDRWLDMGDGHAPAGSKTSGFAIQATQLGFDDIQSAFSIGRAGGGGVLHDSEVFASVRKQTAGPAKPGLKYGPEQLMPRLDASQSNGTQTWQAASLQKLWTSPVRSDSPITYGDRITDAVQKGGFITEQLNDIALQFKAKQPAPGGHLRTRDGFLQGFAGPLRANPLDALQAIIDFNPADGMRAGDKPDAIRDEMNELSTEEERGYTMKQRVDRIKLLMSDQLPAPHQIDVSDGERLVELFETLPASRRKALYRMATGSDFTGDISWKTWNLRADQKARLVALIGQP